MLASSIFVSVIGALLLYAFWPSFSDYFRKNKRVAKFMDWCKPHAEFIAIMCGAFWLLFLISVS